MAERKVIQKDKGGEGLEDAKTEQGKGYQNALIEQKSCYIYMNKKMLLKLIKGSRICHPKICLFSIRIILG